jgi:hypothetical protein
MMSNETETIVVQENSGATEKAQVCTFRLYPDTIRELKKAFYSSTAKTWDLFFYEKVTGRKLEYRIE